MKQPRLTPQDERGKKGRIVHGSLYALWRVLRTVLIYLISATILVVGFWCGYRYLMDNYLSPVSETDHTPVVVEIPKGSGKSKIAELLEEQGVIRSKTVFKLYVDVLGYASKMKAGSYVLNPTMSYRDILDKISTGDGKGEVTDFIVIEGYNIDEMAERLYKDKHIQDVDAFKKLCQSTDDVSNISIIIDMMENIPQEKLAQRKYILEGYLFPAKYEIYTDASANDMIEKMAVKMNSIFTQERIARAQELDMTIDEVITLASIIEKESRPEDFAKVSAVFHNRLNQGMKLQSCPTLQYALGIKRIVLTAEDIASDSPYNTYKYEGLPAGPICAPSEKAIDAAFYPDETFLEDGYLYFVTKDPNSGELEFNIDGEAHEAAAEKYRPLWEEWDRQNAQQDGAQ